MPLSPPAHQVCFRLYTQKQFDAFEAYPTPEIYRVPLDTMLLQMVSMGLPDVRAFPFIEAPEAERIEQTILGLKQHVSVPTSPASQNSSSSPFPSRFTSPLAVRPQCG